MTDMGGGASLLLYTPAGVTGSNDDNDSEILPFIEDFSLMEFMYTVFTRMPCESYRRQIRSLLLCPLSVERC